MDRRELGTQLFGRLRELHGQVLDRSGYRVLAYRRFWPPTSELRRAFESQLDHLRENYVVRPLPEVLQEMRAGRGPVAGTICITVDGGHRDFYTTAYPALRARGLPATLFLPTSFVDGVQWLWFDRVVYVIRNAKNTSFQLNLPGAYPDEEAATYALLTPVDRRTTAGQLTNALRNLSAAEREAVLADVCSQLSVTIPELPTEEFAALTWEEAGEMWPHNISFGAQGISLGDETAIEAELRAAKARIAEKLGDYDIPLLYPNGFYDEQIMVMARMLGYRAAVTNEPGRNSKATNPFRVLRIGVEPVLDPLQFAKLCAILRR